MKKLVVTLFVSLAVLAASVAGAAAAASFGPPSPSAGMTNLGQAGWLDNVSSGRISAATATATLAYWTPERMANAIPVPMTQDATASKTLEPAVAPGAPASFPGAAGTMGAGALNAEPLHAGQVPRPYTNLPDRLNGKVFFTNSPPCGTHACGNYVCSGTIVNSPNKRKIWTAGHCVHGGAGDNFHTNWMFVPAYSSSFNGQRPYGTYTASNLWTRTSWAMTSNLRQDMGAAITNDIAGVRLVDRLGGQGARFNFSRLQSFRDFGYPVAGNPQGIPAFNGFLQWLCISPFISADNPGGVGPLPNRIHCNMGGGSSGGGWIVSMGANGLGYLNSENSYIRIGLPDRIHGPYFGAEALSLYNTSG